MSSDLAPNSSYFIFKNKKKLERWLTPDMPACGRLTRINKSSKLCSAITEANWAVGDPPYIKKKDKIEEVGQLVEHLP